MSFVANAHLFAPPSGTTSPTTARTRQVLVQRIAQVMDSSGDNPQIQEMASESLDLALEHLAIKGAYIFARKRSSLIDLVYNTNTLAELHALEKS